jgi:hypothetical protein
VAWARSGCGGPCQGGALSAVPRVVDLANAALVERSHGAALGVLIAAATSCAEEEARGDVRDGLIDMPLAFRAADLLGLDADALVEEALGRVEGRAAALLREFAGRGDRAAVEAMGWAVVASDAGWRFIGWGVDA